MLEVAPNVSLLEHEHLGSEFRLTLSGRPDVNQGAKQDTALKDLPSKSDDDRLIYRVPAPRLKPNLQKSSGKVSPSQKLPHLLSSKPTTSTLTPTLAPPVSLEIHTPKKRLFSGREILYPRVAPHLGVQVGRENSTAVRVVAKQSKPVIVIDPGHGGYDPGAIGARGTREKVITTAVSNRLAAVLRATQKYEVVLTRTTDVYVEHDDRLRIAREEGADLFMSVHADSTADGKASGASVYTLADRAKNRSKNITHTQNWILDVDLSEQSESVGNILVDLAQRKTITHSSEFASRLVQELEGRVPMVRNSHRRAGYYVLLAPDVPAVLLELGFLSNAADESRLKKQSEQDKIIKAVVRAINGYFDAKKQ